MGLNGAVWMCRAKCDMCTQKCAFVYLLGHSHHTRKWFEYHGRELLAMSTHVVQWVHRDMIHNSMLACDQCMSAVKQGVTAMLLETADPDDSAVTVNKRRKLV